jgi:hypothetical protein
MNQKNRKIQLIESKVPMASGLMFVFGEKA